MQSYIFLTQTLVEIEKIKQILTWIFYHTKGFGVYFNNLSDQTVDAVENNYQSNYQHFLNKKQILNYSFEEKKDYMEQYMSLYQNYTEPTLAFLGNLQDYSIPLQEGMLKLLEEPPKNLNLILFSQNLSEILPTIRSRCNIITLPKSLVIPHLSKNTLAKVASKLPNIKETVQKLINNEKLEFAEISKIEREEIDFWLWQINYYLQEIYKQKPDERVAKTINKVLLAKKFNAQNLQKKLALANLNINNFLIDEI